MARGAMPLVERLQAQARKVLASVQAQIREREADLQNLREQAERWLAAIGGEAPKRRGRPPGSGAVARKKTTKSTRGPSRKTAPKAKRKSPSVDWEKVLAKLPRSFTLQDVAKTTSALRDHQQARVIAVARWSRSRAIKKVADGKYRKAGKSGG